MTSRTNRLKALLKRKDIDSFLISDRLNLYYLGGLELEDSYLLVTKRENFIITDFRYKQEAQAAAGFKVIFMEAGLRDAIQKALAKSNMKSMAFEADHLSYARANSLKSALRKAGIKVEALSGIVEGFRVLKDEYEIKKIKQAIKIAKRALAALKIKPGSAEKSVARELECIIRMLGADKAAFAAIVASGSNSSMPHAVITDRRLRNNEPILVDFGVTVDMYNCDLTRTFVLGKIKGLLSDIYAICREAQNRAIKAIRPGVKARVIDNIARDYIASKGFGKFFGHALGHGVGLSVHESPKLSPKSEDVLRAGMVFTVEPGIYIEKVGGIRIEDMVLVTEKGCEVLTR